MVKTDTVVYEYKRQWEKITMVYIVYGRTICKIKMKSVQFENEADTYCKA
jgi:endonuclease III